MITSKMVDKNRQILGFNCGHFLVTDYARGEYLNYRKCPACAIKRTVKENQENILKEYPDLKEYMELIF